MQTVVKPWQSTRGMQPVRPPLLMCVDSLRRKVRHMSPAAIMHSNQCSHRAAPHLVGLHVGLPKVRVKAATAARRQREQVVEQGPQLLLAEPCSRQILAQCRLTAGSSLQGAGPNQAESTGGKQGMHIAAQDFACD